MEGDPWANSVKTNIKIEIKYYVVLFCFVFFKSDSGHCASFNHMHSFTLQVSNLVQNHVLRKPSQARLQGDQLGLFAYILNMKLVTLLFQLSDLLAIFVFVQEALGELVLCVISGLERLWGRN